MKNFSIAIASSQTYVKQISYYVDKLQEIKQEIPNAVGVEKENKISQDIDSYVGQVMVNQQKMKILLDDLEKNVKETKELDPVRNYF